MMGKKVCVFGMDGFIVPMMKKFVKEGCLPNFKRMLKEGTVNFNPRFRFGHPPIGLPWQPARIREPMALPGGRWM